MAKKVLVQPFYSIRVRWSLTTTATIIAAISRRATATRMGAHTAASKQYDLQ